MCIGWFPVATNWPATVFPFTLLFFFHELNLHSKTNVYNFFQMLQRVTDNTGIMIVKNHSKQLTHVIVDATAFSELAIDCPTCPHPDKNLLDDWEDAPLNIRLVNHALKVGHAMINFIYYAQYHVHTEVTLTWMHSAWEEIHQHKGIFKELTIHDHFNILKFHSMLHYMNVVQSLGCLDGFNTETSEHLHIDYAKNA
ncbi:hypothetical protein A0H81_09904 [Grifola frondosa]|uniref:CxC2-like cysteine cluster KDZ transposase-associated domain-containing protein n=1 Tax=Grifola frondosa TaxID=5627 RepID=A0A1C7M0S8_GRIFR|nr:hypothetical protein A0H81_09904 [Grifola frondosa]